MDATATAKLALDASGFDRGLQQANASLDKFAKQAGAMLAGGFAFDKIISGFSSAIEKGDQLQDLANRFGISASALQEVGNAASLSGAGIEDVASAMNKLAVNAGKAIGGDDAMIQAFKDIGLSVEQLKGMSPQDIFFKLSEAVAGANDPLQAFAMAQEVAGKSVGALMETLRMGPGAIQQMGDEMGIWSDETIAQLGAASDEIKKFQNTMIIAFGSAAQFVNPFIATIKNMAEQVTMTVAAMGEAITGNFAAAKEIMKEANKEQFASFKVKSAKPGVKPFDLEGGGTAGGKAAKAKAAKEAEQAEKDAIKERTDFALSMLKSEDAEKKLANDSYERKRDTERERMLEAANLEVKAAQEKMKLQQEQAAKEKGMAAGPGGTSRQFEQARAGSASEVLNFAGGLGDRGISRTVEQERTKAAKEQQKVNRKEFDAKVMEQTSALTSGGNTRTMESRRREFIQKEAQKESKGTKTLADIYQVLDTALQKIIASPIVSI
jgi:hypothetical protein